jgi:hypothetical protein
MFLFLNWAATFWERDGSEKSSVGIFKVMDADVRRFLVSVGRRVGDF